MPWKEFARFTTLPDDVRSARAMYRSLKKLTTARVTGWGDWSRGGAVVELRGDDVTRWMEVHGLVPIEPLVHSRLVLEFQPINGDIPISGRDS